MDRTLGRIYKGSAAWEKMGHSRNCIKSKVKW